DTLFALGAGDRSALDLLWLSKRLNLVLPQQVGLIDDPWFAATLARAALRQEEQRLLLLRALAEELVGQQPGALPKPLAWPAPGSLASLALIEAGRQGRHQGADIDPRPLPLEP